MAIVITSYSIHYTKLYEEVRRCEQQQVGDHVPVQEGKTKGILRLGEKFHAEDVAEDEPCPGEGLPDHPLKDPQDAEPDAQGDDRITSYNVCYTKLLRRPCGRVGAEETRLSGPLSAREHDTGRPRTAVDRPQMFRAVRLRGRDGGRHRQERP